MNALTWKMKDMLRQIGSDWQRAPVHMIYATVVALEKRGLIETRGSFYGRGFELRRIDAAPEATQEDRADG